MILVLVVLNDHRELLPFLKRGDERPQNREISLFFLPTLSPSRREGEGTAPLKLSAAPWGSFPWLPANSRSSCRGEKSLH